MSKCCHLLAVEFKVSKSQNFSNFQLPTQWKRRGPLPPKMTVRTGVNEMCLWEHFTNSSKPCAKIHVPVFYRNDVIKWSLVLGDFHLIKILVVVASFNG